MRIILILVLLAACTLEPKYSKPDAPVEFNASQSSSKKKISLVAWNEFFQSDDLQRVISLALENSKDLRVAAMNVEIAEQTHGVVRSNLFPTISASASETRQGVVSAFAVFTPKRQYRANLGFTSYEVDFFGRLRSQKKSAFEDYLSSVEAMNIVRIAVITQTANAYAQYLLDRQILKIAEENLAALEEKLKLVELRKKNNIDSATTYLTAQSAAETARISVETYNKIVEQDKNALMALTGVFDIRSIPQDLAIDDIKINQSALDFVASENLLARPDIKQAEHNLIAANANIGAARAAFFPSISLTANYGYTSRQLNGLFDSKMWSLTPQINLPIFSGGRNIANLNIAEARKNLQVAQYEKTIQNAFRETLDSLAEKKALDNQKQSYTNIFKASQASYRISEKKNKVGAMSKMDVINAKISLLEAEKNHLSNKKELLANLITLYKVMGGGADYNETDSSK